MIIYEKKRQRLKQILHKTGYPIGKNKKQTNRKKHSSDQGNANQNPNGKKSSCPYRVE